MTTATAILSAAYNASGIAARFSVLSVRRLVAFLEAERRGAGYRHPEVTAEDLFPIFMRLSVASHWIVCVDGRPHFVSRSGLPGSLVIAEGDYVELEDTWAAWSEVCQLAVQEPVRACIVRATDGTKPIAPLTEERKTGGWWQVGERGSEWAWSIAEHG